jgi:hypothetical protein
MSASGAFTAAERIEVSGKDNDLHSTFGIPPTGSNGSHRLSAICQVWAGDEFRRRHVMDASMASLIR